jgi:signal transduction histidine kinase
MGVKAQNGAPDDLVIVADRTQLYRSLFNLVRNAVEAMTPAPPPNGATPADGAYGEVTITAAAEDGAVAILIADTGPGIPEHAKAELFEPFKGSLKPGGSGLGVAIAAEIVRAHGGSLTLHKSDENGAVFRIVLPYKQTAAITPALQRQ